MDRLDDLGIADNTIILFTSDNGPTYIKGTYTPWFDSGGPFKSERGWGKGYLREGGIRMPFIARWPDHIPAGVISDHVSSSQDIMATIFDLLALPLPLEHDGISMAPALLGQNDQLEHDYLYWEFPESSGQRALRWGDWKDTTIHLYHLATDIQEQIDIASEHPDKVQYVRDIFRKEHTPAQNPRWRYDVIDQ